MTLEVYDELIEIFAHNFRVIVVEFPGMGFSATQLDFSFEFHDYTDDLAIFLKFVAGEQAILVFYCVAGLTAIDIAVCYPKFVSHLTLIQTGDVQTFACSLLVKSNAIDLSVVIQLGGRDHRITHQLQ